MIFLKGVIGFLYYYYPRSLWCGLSFVLGSEQVMQCQVWTCCFFGRFSWIFSYSSASNDSISRLSPTMTPKIQDPFHVFIELQGKGSIPIFGLLQLQQDPKENPFCKWGIRREDNAKWVFCIGWKLKRYCWRPVWIWVPLWVTYWRQSDLSSENWIMSWHLSESSLTTLVEGGLEFEIICAWWPVCHRSLSIMHSTLPLNGWYQIPLSIVRLPGSFVHLILTSITGLLDMLCERWACASLQNAAGEWWLVSQWVLL